MIFCHLHKKSDRLWIVDTTAHAATITNFIVLDQQLF
jgi:hypothetical protein